MITKSDALRACEEAKKHARSLGATFSGNEEVLFEGAFIAGVNFAIRRLQIEQRDSLDAYNSVRGDHV